MVYKRFIVLKHFIMVDQYSHEELLKALLKGNRVKSSEIIDGLLRQNISINDIYEKSIKKAMYQLGKLWEFGKISVATEHLASAIVEAELNGIYLKRVPGKSIEKTVVIACIENEFHQIGVKMVSDIFDMNGWITYFLGSNVPVNELIDFIKNTDPDLVALSQSIYFNLFNLEITLKLLNNEFPDLKILVGGQAFLHGGREIFNDYSNVDYLEDLYKLESFLQQ